MEPEEEEAEEEEEEEEEEGQGSSTFISYLLIYNLSDSISDIYPFNFLPLFPTYQFYFLFQSGFEVLFISSVSLSYENFFSGGLISLNVSRYLHHAHLPYRKL